MKPSCFSVIQIFYVTSILENAKITIFAILVAHILEKSKLEARNVVKWQFLEFLENDKNWFHVKYEWQKNAEIFTLRCITVWKSGKYTHFDKNFVKAKVLLEKLLNSWLDELFFGERISCFSTLWVINSFITVQNNAVCAKITRY